MLMVMTGGTRGLGAVAAQRIGAATAGTDAIRIMGVRDPASTTAAPPNWQPLPLDLASLDSVRAFAAALPDRPITHLILNAGGQRSDDRTRSVDGYEVTFATNHLAHYLLLRLLMPRLAPGARILITSSGTHDPAEKTGIPPPRHARADWLAHPEQNPDHDRMGAVAGMRAYSSSKLCNLMTARHLAASDAARDAGWQVFAYDPGLTPGTGLARSQPWFVRTLIWPLLPLVLPFASSMNSLKNAGRGLADLAMTATAPPGRVYAALRKGKLTWPDPSDIARNGAAVAALWEDSARLVGLRA